jgi:hypothetical protein
VDAPATRTRWLVRLVWLYLGAQFLPWVFQRGGGVHGFFVPSFPWIGWYLAFSELAVGLALAVVVLVRLADVAPRARFALPEVSVALAAVTAARLLIPFTTTTGSYAVVPGVGAFVGVAAVVGLVAVAFVDRRLA